MTNEEYEAATIRGALEGDHEDGREALRLCRDGLIYGNLSPQLAAYLAERLLQIDEALDLAKATREVKKSSGSARSVRHAAIAEALCIARPAGRARDPLPDWQVCYAAFGMLLLKADVPPEKVKGAMDEVRRLIEGKDAGLDRGEAGKILKAYSLMRNLPEERLLHLAGPKLREILPTYLPQTQRR